jgi:hypothetical protein
MRRVFASALALACACVCSTAMAQPNPCDPGGTGGCTGTTGAGGGASSAGGGGGGGSATSASKHHQAAAHRVKGAVSSDDATAKSIVIHPATGADLTIKVNDKTTYWIGKKKGSSDDLKVGANVVILYRTDGADNWATNVKIYMAATVAKTGSR